MDFSRGSDEGERIDINIFVSSTVKPDSDSESKQMSSCCHCSTEQSMWTTIAVLACILSVSIGISIYLVIDKISNSGGKGGNNGGNETPIPVPTPAPIPSIPDQPTTPIHPTDSPTTTVKPPLCKPTASDNGENIHPDLDGIWNKANETVIKTNRTLSNV